MRTRTALTESALAVLIALTAGCHSDDGGAGSGTVPGTSGQGAPSTSSSSPSATSSSSSAPSGGTHTVVVSAGDDATKPFDATRKLTVPAGWQVSVWARVPGARLEAWAPDGRLLVSRPGHGDVVALQPQGSGAPRNSTLVSGLRQPHGLAFDGSTLYVGESNQIDRYTYANGTLSDHSVIVDNLPDSKSPQLHGHYAHALKSVLVGRDHSVYISVGSSANISAEDRAASPPRAVILRWSPQTQRTTVFAQGVRNGTGLGLDPSGAVWTAMNNRDRMPYPFHRDYDGDGKDDYGKVIQSYVNDHPLEPVAKLTAGRDLGWPYCDPDPSVQPGVAGSKLSYSARPFVNDPDTNPTGSKLNCATLSPLEQGLPAHSAPLGLTFVTLPGSLGAGAIATSHGSWNRTPPQAPSLTFLPWRNGTLGAPQPLVTGFQNGDGSRWGRTVDAVIGPDHALYVSDDGAGAIYRITMG